MTEIRDTGAINYTKSNIPKNPPVKADSEEIKQPTDEVTLSKPKKSFGKKVIEFPGKVIKAAAGTVVGVATTPLHVIPGAVKGMHEGVTEYKGEGEQGSFHVAMFAQNMIAGASVGFLVGGVLGAFIGGGAGLALSGITTYIGGKSEAYDKMTDDMEAKIGKALEDNKGTKTEVAFQNATEGSIIGSATGLKTGWKVGYESGKGIVSGVVGAVEGIAEGVYEVGKNIATGMKGKK
ncbi:MAG: hypothetical protein K8T10_05320 [Candidatus Eremiobacteraeota bacterium]|nr:hypothetical protein [Candidatus Eremiobacteraeota bacterium]